MNSLEDLLAEGRETIDAMVADGLDPAEIYDIEHHVVSPNFDKLEKAAVDLVKAGFQVDDAEEFENEDGKTWYYFAAVVESELSHAKLEEQTKAVYEVTSKAGVEYDGWGTYLGEDEELDEDDE